MKKAILTLIALTMLAAACQNPPKKESSPAAPPETPKEVSVPTPQAAANDFTQDRLIGTWRSTLDKKSTIQFMAADRKYSSNYEGKVVEQGNWDIPTTCAECTVEAQDGCFFFKEEDGNTCCSIVKTSVDSLQYIVSGTTGKIQSFVKVKR